MTVRLTDASKAAVCGRYMLDQVVGRGGMGVVYRAHDLKHGRDVALKIIPRENLSAEAVHSFHREIRLTARLQHPHILPLLDSGELDGAPYYVTPFVEDGSLRDRMERDGTLAIRAVARVLEAVGGALEYAHRNQVIHCDIKPENILLSGRHAILSDFGISRALRSDPAEWRDVVDRSVVTPGYGSPEQLLGLPVVDGRTDVFSLGCVTFEMLTGKTPLVQGADREALPKNIKAVLTKATAADESQRYGSVEKFTAAFARAAGFSTWREPLMPRVWRRVMAGARLVRRRSRRLEWWHSDTVTNERRQQAWSGGGSGFP